MPDTPSRPLSPELAACPHCDALHQRQPLARGQVALCSRCATPLYESRSYAPLLPMVFVLTGLLLFVIANSYPLLYLELAGRVQASTLLDGVVALWQSDLWLMALLVLLTSLLAPLWVLLALLYLLWPVWQRQPPPPAAASIVRTLSLLTPWSMSGVYTLGLVIAIVKLRDLASVMPGIGLYTYFAFLLASIAAQITVDAALKRRLLTLDTRQAGGQRAAGVAHQPALALPPTAREAGLGLCACCNLLVRMPVATKAALACPQCGSLLHSRKPASLSQTWALLLTAVLLYLPANLLPIMTVIRFGQGDPDTILSGIQHLLENGLWPLALLIFYASIVVPMMKIVVLSFLLLSVQWRSSWRPKERTTLYRIIESFGHWSMVDIFLISILTALVQLGTLSTIEPGSGATFFGLVVVATMLATQRFDPRLIWDALEQSP
ncbi:MAG: PqiA/YebS family transporter subunit [Magnetococcales bacterium]|nr:PqiA/YebS family transporter subunit [Magnetococcales bacterium]